MKKLMAVAALAIVVLAMVTIEVIAQEAGPSLFNNTSGEYMSAFVSGYCLGYGLNSKYDQNAGNMTWIGIGGAYYTSTREDTPGLHRTIFLILGGMCGIVSASNANKSYEEEHSSDDGNGTGPNNGGNGNGTGTFSIKAPTVAVGVSATALMVRAYIPF